MDRLDGFKNITLTEAIEEIKKLRQSLIGAVQNAECREEEKDKELERLKKEKEWLFLRSIRNDSHTWAIHIDTARERLTIELQQALKEE